MPGAAPGHSAGRAGAEGSPEVRLEAASASPWPRTSITNSNTEITCGCHGACPDLSRGCCELHNPQPTPTSAREHPTL